MGKLVKHFRGLLLLGLFGAQMQEQRAAYHGHGNRSTTVMITGPAQEGSNQEALDDEEDPKYLRELVQKGRIDWPGHKFECLACCLGERIYRSFDRFGALEKHRHSNSHYIYMLKLHRNKQWQILYTELQGRVYKGN